MMGKKNTITAARMPQPTSWRRPRCWWGHVTLFQMTSREFGAVLVSQAVESMLRRPVEATACAWRVRSDTNEACVGCMTVPRC